MVLERPALLAQRAHGAEPHDDQAGGGVERLRVAEGAAPGLEGPGEAGRERVRDVVIAGHREEGEADGVEEPARPLELLGPAPVGQVARGQQELRLEACDEPGSASSGSRDS